MEPPRILGTQSLPRRSEERELETSSQRAPPAPPVTTTSISRPVRTTLRVPRLKEPASAVTFPKGRSLDRLLLGRIPSRLVHPTSGIVFDILKIEGTQPGQNPVVTFSIKTKKGEAINAAQMNNLRLVVAWPTTDYKVAVEEDARKAEAQGNGVYLHKFKYKIPSEAPAPAPSVCRATKSQN